MATRTIKTRLEISGDKEYTDKLKKVNAELAEQKSKLTLLDNQYKDSRNSQEALSKKVDLLKEKYEAQKKVVNAATEGLRNAAKEQEKYEAIIKNTNEKLQIAQIERENLNKDTEEGRKRQEELNQQIEEYQKQLEEATKKQDEISKGVDYWAEQQSKANTAVNKTSKEINDYEGYLEEAKKSTDHCATSIDQYGKKVKKAAEEHKELDGRLDSSEAALESLAAAITAIGVSKGVKEITEALHECIDAYAEVETALAKVSTIADTSVVGMDAMKESILRLSNETGKSVNELSEATYNAISAGVDTAGAVQFVGTATKLATGGFTDNSTAVDILTTVLNAYNMELERAGEVSDYLITTQNLGKTTVNELASSMGKVIPVAATYNVEMSNLSSAMAILTSKGIATAESTTYMKAMLNELGDSGSVVSKTLVEQTGVSFAKLMEQGKSLGDVMEILGKAVDNDKGAFNELWSSNEAGIAALSLLSSGAEQYNEVLLKMKNSAGATSDAYEKMANTVEISQQKMSNAFFNLKVAVGNEIQDQISGIYDAGTDLLTWASEFIQENQWLIPIIESLVLTLGALTAAVTAYTVVTKVAIPLILKFGAALSGNPVGIVTTAVVGLTAALAPFIAEMVNAKKEAENVKTEVMQQAEAWRGQAASLNEAVAAYRSLNDEEQQSESNITKQTEILKDLIEKENKTAAEKQAIADAAKELNDIIPGLGLSYDSLSDSINMTSEEMHDLLEAMELQKRYENARSNYADVYSQRKKAAEDLAKAEKALIEAKEEETRLYREREKYANKQGITNAEYEYYLSVKDQLKVAQKEVAACQVSVSELTNAMEEADVSIAEMTYDMNRYNIESANMTESEREVIDTMLESAETMRDNIDVYYEEIQAVADLADIYNRWAEEAKASYDSVMVELNKLQEKYDESYNSAYTSISNQIGLFKEIKMESSMTIDEMIKNFDAQIEYMNQYADNMRKAMELGVDKELLEQLSDGSEQSAAILQEIVNGSEEKIEELNETFARVSEGKEEFATAIAEMETYYGEELDKLIEDTVNAVHEMARYDDAYRAAEETCKGYIAGIEANRMRVIEAQRSLVTAMTQQSYLNSNAGNGSPQIVEKSTSQTFNIYQPVKTPSEMMRAARMEERINSMAGD